MAVPRAGAAEQAGKLILDLPKLWKKANDEKKKQTGYPHIHIFYTRLKWLLSKEDVSLLWKMGRAGVEYANSFHLGGYFCKYITKMGGWSDEALIDYTHHT